MTRPIYIFIYKEYLGFSEKILLTKNKLIFYVR